MADLSDLESAQTTKIVGSDASGVEQTPVQSTANGAMHTNLRDASGTEILPATATNQTTEIGILNTIASNTGAQSVDRLATGSITALNGVVSVDAQGAFTISVNILGTWVQTLVAEGLMADATTWVQLPLYQISTTLPYSSVFSTTTNGNFLITGGGYTSVRIRSSSFTSGTASISLNASLAQQTISSAQLGSWTFTQNTATKQTYGTSITSLNTAGTATDIFTITGSATKTIRVKHLSLDATQTTASNINVLVIKRSTANSGGTSSQPTIAAFDSQNAAATAVVRAYTANPTSLGTSVGTIHSEKVYVPTVTGAGGDELKFDYVENTNMQEIVLRGTGEVLAINLNSTTIGGGLFNIDITWTEE